MIVIISWNHPGLVTGPLATYRGLMPAYVVAQIDVEDPG